jgi:hypothetical protein
MRESIERHSSIAENGGGGGSGVERKSKRVGFGKKWLESMRGLVQGSYLQAIDRRACGGSQRRKRIQTQAKVALVGGLRRKRRFARRGCRCALRQLLDRLRNTSCAF